VLAQARQLESERNPMAQRFRLAHREELERAESAAATAPPAPAPAPIAPVIPLGHPGRAPQPTGGGQAA
jgi:hypothetical protein